VGHWTSGQEKGNMWMGEWVEGKREGVRSFKKRESKGQKTPGTQGSLASHLELTER